jgi:uncharacterized protein YcbK (DUF882 family)
MPRERLTSNFYRDEFACQGENCCNNSAPISLKLVTLLQKLRNLSKKPLIVTSGFRCNKHNKAIGGAENSYHTKGMAVDVKTPLPAHDFLLLIKKIPEIKGVGIYSSWFHLDIRDKEYCWID